MPYSANIIRLLNNLEPQLKEVFLALLEEIEKQRLETVTKNEFNELKAIVKELAEAQKRTEERVSELAEAQRKTEERVSVLAEAQRKTEERLNELAEAQRKTEERLNELAEAQRKTEERLNELAEAQRKTEERLNELAEAQRKTEERLNELAEAQKRTEERVNKLAEAQRKTERELEKLIGEHRKTREMIGSLQHTVGYVLEDRAIAGLPSLLKKEYGIEVSEHFRRDYIEVSPRNFLEINIIGKGKRNGKEIWIIGECKTQLKKKDVDEFLKKLKKIDEILSGEKFPIIVTYETSPPVRNYVEEHGLKLYFSYQFPI